MGDPVQLDEILEAVPAYRVFPSVELIRRRVGALAAAPGFKVRTVGRSEAGRPIHHVRFGAGRVKALFSAYPHPNEPIGGLTVLTLMELLRRRHPALSRLPVEWHFLPCPDPDGVDANAGWMRRPFSFERYLREYYRPPHDLQIEWSFPIRYKKARFDKPTRGTRALMRVFEEVRPGFYFSLHNSMFGGAYYFISRDLGAPTFRRFYRLLDREGIPLHRGEPEVDFVPRYAPAVYGEVTFKAWYDRTAESYPDPREHLAGGGSSFEYLRRFNPRSLTLVFETAFSAHPLSRSTRPSRENRRHLMLKAQASQKYLASLAIARWKEVRKDVDRGSVFFPSVRSRLDHEAKTLDRLDRRLLFSPEYGRPATESERLDIYLGWYLHLCSFHQLVRLLRTSRSKAAAEAAAELSREIRSQYRRIDDAIDFGAFRNLDIRALVRAQLGSGLIALRSLL